MPFPCETAEAALVIHKCLVVAQWWVCTQNQGKSLGRAELPPLWHGARDGHRMVSPGHRKPVDDELDMLDLGDFMVDDLIDKELVPDIGYQWISVPGGNHPSRVSTGTSVLYYLHK